MALSEANVKESERHRCYGDDALSLFTFRFKTQ
ncbi:hypothetical protein EDC54_101295 [Samsonia erythrinae]|uniref:Uncharacterized protein n=1 Tax=Samsonia erythrinae TaxID=160434 RepID=A0A4R3VTT0_9GAMM|nr:hypothetical protein EDC54_101295 [Samsonia erythrinae]